MTDNAGIIRNERCSPSIPICLARDCVNRLNDRAARRPNKLPVSDVSSHTHPSCHSPSFSRHDVNRDTDTAEEDFPSGVAQGNLHCGGSLVMHLNCALFHLRICTARFSQPRCVCHLLRSIVFFFCFSFSYSIELLRGS